jgi:glycosyltransferase involved in cell wall biosynthesis
VRRAARKLSGTRRRRQRIAAAEVLDFAIRVGVCCAPSDGPNRTASIEIQRLAAGGRAHRNVRRESRTRVLLLLPGAFGPAGGLEMYNRLLIKALHAITVERGGTCETLLLLDEEGHLDDRYFEPTLPRPRAFAASRPRFAAATVEQIARLRPDLVVFGHVNFSPVALIARAMRPQARQWFITHGIEVWRRMSRAQRLAVGSADSVLAVSDYTRNQLVRNNDVARDLVGLQPCALDPIWAADFASLKPKTSPDPARPLLLTVARLAETERHKGIEQVIRALPAVAAKVPGIRYAIVGDGSDRPRLERAARDAGVADRVDFRGRISPAALAEAYAESSLFVMPSAKEGFGIVFLEAALFGKPSIGGNHGGTPEVIVEGETGRLVAYDDVAGFASTCSDLLADPVRLAAMGAAAHRRLDERFTYASFLRALRAHVDAGLNI